MTGIIPSYLTLFGLEGSYGAWWFFIIIIFSFLSYLTSEHWGSRGIGHRAGRLQLALGWSFFNWYPGLERYRFWRTSWGFVSCLDSTVKRCQRWFFFW